MRKLFIWLFGASASFAVSAQALDTIVLSNGDRLTGTVIKSEAGTLHFRSEVLGLLQLPADKVQVERAESKAAEVIVANTEMQHPAAETPSGPVEPKQDKKEKSNWKRRFEFGYTDLSGRKERSDLSLRANFDWKSEGSEFRGIGRYLYASNGEKIADNLRGSARYRRSFFPSTFGQTELNYRRDEIKRINHDLSQSIGIGHNIVDEKKVRLGLGGGGAAIYRSTQTMPGRWFYAVDAFQDFSYEINRFVKVTQDFSMLAKPLNDNEFSFELHAALITTITDSVNLAMRYEYDYDNSLLPDARTSRRLVTSLAYVF